MHNENGRVVDFFAIADLRDYFDTAAEFGELEKYRKRIERTHDQEALRNLFENEGPVFLPEFGG